MRSIAIVLSTDAAGFRPNSTLLASILRRTTSRVHVRCWCRGFLPDSFESGRLKVEFIAAEAEVSGTFPGYVGPAVFDRLRVIDEVRDWDKCLILDYDQLALCDLAPLFELDLGDKLLAAKMQGPGVDMAYAMRTWIRRPFPEGWEHVAGYPYFSMGPLLNLKAMREAGTWDKLLAAHAAFGMDEQLSLTAATEGRTMGFERKWNLFPKQDIDEGTVPEGVIHWLGWPKPWHKGANVWRPDIWESERTSWEQLRMGLWDKPLAVELEPEDETAALALAKRGWRVKVFSRRYGEAREEDPGGTPAPLEEMDFDKQDDGGTPALLEFPDLERLPASKEAFHALLEEHGGAIDQVRLGAWEDAAEWLEGVRVPPAHLVLGGGIDAAEADRVRALGYREEVRLMRGEWAAGGPSPRALDYGPCRSGVAIRPGEDVYLHWDGAPWPEDGFKVGARPDARRVGLCANE